MNSLEGSLLSLGISFLHNAIQCNSMEIQHDFRMKMRKIAGIRLFPILVGTTFSICSYHDMVEILNWDEGLILRII